jgi:glutamine cyclotransferase
MRINVTEFNNDRRLDWNDVIAWFGENIGKVKFTDKHSCQGEGWRLYTEELKYDWLSDTIYWLEFDDDMDYTSFLLRWS